MADGKAVYDTSIYVELLRSKTFTETLRLRYATDIPVTLFSSVVVQELLNVSRALQGVEAEA
ncbi:MAG: hypothetical protein HYY46_09385 [Deltaproteobacteria bacterium]|nr:hypothetical protein [Deltaproteobacteria bacterium]